MYTSFQLARKYFQHVYHAGNPKGHGMHSPFVFNFLLDVLQNRHKHAPPLAIEKLRRSLKQNKEVLTILDLGAGSRKAPSIQRTVGQIARNAVKPRKYGQLLYRLVKQYQPQTIIELGTSLGLTTAYLASAAPQARVVSIEGSQAIHEAAKENLRPFALPHIELMQGNFDEILPRLLATLSTVDLGFIDGNHRYEPTIAYFDQFLTKINSQSILVFDDIHWSAEMEQAWEEIRQHPSVTCTIDIFFLGFVFFRTEFHEPQHFTVRY